MPVWDPYDDDLGGNTEQAMENSRVILWKGHCSVHQMFHAAHVKQFRERIAEIKILVHPECPREVNDLADVSGSTGKIIETVRGAAPGTKWAIGTELHLVNRLKKEHPATYLFSHMLIMPLIAFYVSAFDWLCVCRAMPQGISWVLSVAFFCGLVLELGRKIRIPRLEREGVETYSALWGTGNSVAIWLVSIVAAVAAYANAAALITSSSLHIGLGAAALAIGILTLSLFSKRYDHGYPEFAAKIIEPSSGLVAMLLYLGLGPIQAIIRLQGA